MSASRTGYRPDCNECRKPIQAAYQKNNPEKGAEKQARWKANNPEAAKAVMDRYNESHREQRREQSRDWQQNNKEADAKRSAQQRLEKKQATPPWADKEKIKSIYKQAQEETRETGIQMHVDHEVPLKGKNVSGLHVENNLRIIPALPNLQKKNSFNQS